MQADKTTVNDLSIFHREEEQSVFHHLDFTTTIGGKDWFRYLLANPYSDLQKIQKTNKTLKLIMEKKNRCPAIISNETVMMVQKFYDSQINLIPKNSTPLNSLFYRVTNPADY